MWRSAGRSGARRPDPPFPLLAAALGVDKDEQRVSVWHGADLLKDEQVGVSLRLALMQPTNGRRVQFQRLISHPEPKTARRRCRRTSQDVLSTLWDGLAVAALNVYDNHNHVCEQNNKRGSQSIMVDVLGSLKQPNFCVLAQNSAHLESRQSLPKVFIEYYSVPDTS